MALVWLLLGAVLVLVVSSFGAQNAAAVTLDFFGYQFVGVPLWLVLVVPAVVGLLLGFVLGLPGAIRAALARRRLAAQIAERDQTIGQLRQRVAELEHEAAIARRPAAPAVAGDLPDVPSETPRSRLNAA
jgi:uncharacterized integral membrane protein